MKISIDVDVLNAIASDARKANSECQKAYQIINMVTKGTAWLCREKDDINDNLKSLNRQINNLSEDFSVFAITADSVATNFRDYVYSIDKKYLKDMKSMIGIFGFAAGEVTNIATNVGRKTQILMSELSNKVYGKLFNLNTASIVAACTIPGTIVPFAMFNVTQHAINQASGLANSLINTHNNTPNNVTVTTAADIEQINQSAKPPAYDIPEQFLREFTYSRIIKNGKEYLVAKPGNVYVWNEENKELSCTYYTLRKLQERGLGFPANRAGSGRQFIENLEKSGVKDIPYKREGNKSLEALINDNGLPMDNVVLSFDWKEGTYTGDNMGHVVLIDHIKENEKGEKICIFSDMNEVKGIGDKITDINGSNPQVEMPLDQFLEYYGKKNNLNGAAVIGAGKGDY